MTDLDFPDLVGLELRCAVVMNNSYSTHELWEKPVDEMKKAITIQYKCWYITFLWVLLTAIAMAMEDSVTVSMGEEMSGVFRVILRVRADVKSYDNTWPL